MNLDELEKLEMSAREAREDRPNAGYLLDEEERLSEALRNAARELIADARRYRWLRARFFGVDFEYDGGDDKSLCVVVFKIDDTTRVSGDLNASIDAVIAQEEK